MSALRDKVALVTGASRGVGKGVALGLAEAGATIYITGRTVDEGHGVGNLPGLVRTESVLRAAEHFDLSNSESPRFIGRAVAALAADPDVMRKSGQVLGAAELAVDYGFVDVDGRQPASLREM